MIVLEKLESENRRDRVLERLSSIEVETEYVMDHCCVSVCNVAEFVGVIVKEWLGESVAEIDRDSESRCCD